MFFIINLNVKAYTEILCRTAVQAVAFVICFVTFACVRAYIINCYWSRNVCVCVCVSKLFELAKDKTLKDAEKIKFLCKLFNVAEYVFTQHIVF